MGTSRGGGGRGLHQQVCVREGVIGLDFSKQLYSLRVVSCSQFKLTVTHILTTHKCIFHKDVPFLLCGYVFSFRIHLSVL